MECWPLVAGCRAGGQVAVLCKGHAAWGGSSARSQAVSSAQQDGNRTRLLHERAAASVSEALATHRLYCETGEEPVHRPGASSRDRLERGLSCRWAGRAHWPAQAAAVCICQSHGGTRPRAAAHHGRAATRVCGSWGRSPEPGPPPAGRGRAIRGGASTQHHPLPTACKQLTARR